MFGRIRVHGHSMSPTFQPGEVLWSNRLSLLFRAPRRGDVVVVDHPNEQRRLLKRVTGVPGDLIAGRRLGPDEYFVQGDNAAHTTDSEVFGAIPRRLIRARVSKRPKMG